SVLSYFSFSLMSPRPPPISSLFPYTTLFRSLGRRRPRAVVRDSPHGVGVRLSQSFHGRDAARDECGGMACPDPPERAEARGLARDRKSTRLNSSHDQISYAVFCLKKKKTPKS